MNAGLRIVLIVQLMLAAMCGAQLWLLAGKNASGEIAVLAANPLQADITWKIAPVAGRAVASLKVLEINDSSDGIVNQTINGNALVIHGYTVQLVTFNPNLNYR